MKHLIHFFALFLIIVSIVAVGAGESNALVSNKVKGVVGAGVKDKPLTAFVTADKARFLLPIGGKDSWRWNLESGKQSGFITLEYEWAVEIENGPTLYRFGFRRMNKDEEPQQSGDLAALIKAGFVTSWQVSGNWQGPFEAEVIVEPAGENIIISISGKENIRKVFSSRPKKVKFIKIQPPVGDRVVQDVLVMYKK